MYAILAFVVGLNSVKDDLISTLCSISPKKLSCSFKVVVSTTIDNNGASRILVDLAGINLGLLG